MRWFKSDLKWMAVFIIVGAAPLVLNGCGGEGGGGSSSGAITTPIANAAEGGAAGSSAQAAATVGTGISDLATSLGSLGGSSLGLSLSSKPMNPMIAKDPMLYKMTAEARKAASSNVFASMATHLKEAMTRSKSALIDVSPSGTCENGGSWTATGTVDTIGSFDVRVAFSSCRKDGDQADGQIHITGTKSSTSADIRTVMGDHSTSPATDLVILTYSDTSYVSLVGRFSTTMDTHRISNCGAGSFVDGSCTAGTHFLTATGTASYDNYTVTPVQTTDLTMTSFTDNNSFLYDSRFNPEVETFDDTLGGSVNELRTETDGTHTMAVSFSNFNIHVVDNITLSTPVFAKRLKSSLDRFTSFEGTVSINFTPDSDCPFEGIFTIITDIPLHRTSPDSCPIAGHLTINRNTTVLYNGDGSVDVATGSDTKHYASCNDLDAVCRFEDFKPSGGQVLGSNGTSVSGNGFLVTLSWNDLDQKSQTSDMDLHVGYYNNPNPTAGPADAEISWHTGDTLGVGYNSTKFGTAMAELDFDDSQGNGPEHVTVTGLPAGYYVIAVDSFALDLATRVTVNSSVTIGGTIYTFPPHTFITADSDASEPSMTVPPAWYRVTDLQCLTDGDCTFVTPNLNLQVQDNPS